MIMTKTPLCRLWCELHGPTVTPRLPRARGMRLAYFLAINSADLGVLLKCPRSSESPKMRQWVYSGFHCLSLSTFCSAHLSWSASNLVNFEFQGTFSDFRTFGLSDLPITLAGLPNEARNVPCAMGRLPGPLGP